MTDARKRAEEMISKILDFHDLNCCGGDYCDYLGNGKFTEYEESIKIMSEALTSYAKEETEKLEDKIAEYHNAYEGAKQRNHVLEAELNAMKLKSAPLVMALEELKKEYEKFPHEYRWSLTCIGQALEEWRKNSK